MTEEKEYIKEIIQVPCECGCSIFEIHAWYLDKEWEYFGLFYKLARGQKSSIKKAIKEKAKLLWCILTGKEYSFWDITLQKENLEKLRDELNYILDLDKEQ